MQRKNLFLMFVLMAMALSLSACGDAYNIPPGYVGKQILTSGLEKEIRRTGAHRTELYMTRSNPDVVLLEDATNSDEKMIPSIILDKSNITLENVTFGITYRVRPDDDSINQAFTLSPDKKFGNGIHVISGEAVYNRYISKIAGEIVINIMREYEVEQAYSNVGAISRAVLTALNKELADTPVEIVDFRFPNGMGTPPESVKKAQEALYSVKAEQARQEAYFKMMTLVEDLRQGLARKRFTNDNELASTYGMSIAELNMLRTMERMIDSYDSFAEAAKAGTPVALGAPFIPFERLNDLVQKNIPPVEKPEDSSSHNTDLKPEDKK